MSTAPPRLCDRTQLTQEQRSGACPPGPTAARPHVAMRTVESRALKRGGTLRIL